ncbi:MAG: hypothetical protein LRY66_16780 [Saccharospirillaceae bacterium]|nr:hypothetical protein [Saccharospirillaceae bacterium]MCD8532959.1 hypothetical protein [Saccharospirillaceae bacterium]
MSGQAHYQSSKPENVVQQGRINRVTPEENRSQTLIAAHHHCHQEGWL